jgi:hypothetical protein
MPRIACACSTWNGISGSQSTGFGPSEYSMSGRMNASLTLPTSMTTTETHAATRHHPPSVRPVGKT